MDCHIGAAIDGAIHWQRVNVLWDTGTSTTVISPVLAARLGLKPKDGDYIDLNVVGGIARSWMTVVYVGFPNHKVYGPLPVAVKELPSTDVLLGMDVISIGTFLLEPKPDGGTKFMFIL